MGRTGTQSLQRALEILGVGPCYHQFDIVSLNAQKEGGIWFNALQRERAGEKNVIDMKEYFANSPYKSSMDYPFCAFYKEIAEAFSETKFILTVRDPESWYRSYVETILKSLFDWRTLAASKLVPFFHKRIFISHHMLWRFFGAEFLENPDYVHKKDHMIRCYQEHNKKVQATIPSDRLLVYEVKQGWGPLCKFLGVPVPNVPFPHNNDVKDFWRQICQMRMLTFVAAGACAVGVALAYFKFSWGSGVPSMPAM